MHDRRSAPGVSVDDPTFDPTVEPGPEVSSRGLGVLGRRSFIAGVAATGTALAAAPLAGTAHAVEPGAGYFHAIDPRRICDTRERRGFTRISSNVIRVKVAGTVGVPAGAIAAVLTVTAVNRHAGGNWVAVYPATSGYGGTSNLNCEYYDQRVANLVTVKVGASGAYKGWVEIRTFGPAEVIVDVAGVYLPTAAPVAAGRFVGRSNPARAIDTRRTNGKPGVGAEVDVSLYGLVPSDATAVVATLTVVDANFQGYCTAYPTGIARPLASNINPAAGEARAVGIMTKIGSRNGRPSITVYTFAGAHIIVDVAGYITGAGAGSSSAGLFVPIDPLRLVDSRDDKQRLWPGWTRATTLPTPINSKAQAVVVNVTATETMNGGYFTMLAAQTQRLLVSNLNASRAGQTVANHAVVRASTKGIACYSLSGAHVIFDVTGWFTGVPVHVTTGAPVNPNPPPAPLPWTVNCARMGLSNGVHGGVPDPIVDAGLSWHWSGTGLVGDPSRNVVLFGHRTDGPAPWGDGGVFRYQHNLRAGDLLYVYTSDRRVYTYRMVAEYIRSKYANDILAATRVVGGETLSLVACSKTNRLPTSLSYRIISTFQLVEWADLG
ncbi:MAG: sortase [Acidimicrobiia bacterium]|nr:sortase [Acidimicrobiia bacterium]